MSQETQKTAYLDQVQHQAALKFGSSPFEVLLNNGYADVIFRLGKALPLPIMLDWFSSTPSSTGGSIRFPYQRIDSNLNVVSDHIDLMNGKNENKQKEHYEFATEMVAKTLTWIHIGWNGLEKFASSNATKNWTGGPGHNPNAIERETYIMTNGKQWIDQMVVKYRAARKTYDPKYGENDVFRKYNIEYLLMK
jgi:hypothetical protein